MAPAPASTRIALVIGNAAYSEARLDNPVGDARAIAERLRAAGFRVALKLDAPRRRRAGGDPRLRRSAGRRQPRRRRLQPRRPRRPARLAQLHVAGGRVIHRPADIAAQGVDVGLLLESLGRARNPLNW
ncbi:MAG: caspase family protein [Candidatus Accumulibacter sp.]|nr:caspase family protein [Accumulibacter sp.]